MRILVFNCGSSSLKYRLLEMPSETELCGGEAQRIASRTAEPARLAHRVGSDVEVVDVAMPDHAAAFEQVMRLLPGDFAPDGVAHRVVHGGGEFDRSALVDAGALAKLDAVSDLAPIHNPPAIRLIRACAERFPQLPQVAVFDTAFHSTIPPYAATYALPRDLCTGLGIRKYGFHGISHRYVAAEAARLLGKDLERLNAVSCHLGSGGASLCAVVGGRSVDNTMGFSPLQGLVMSTRCGDLDPALPLHLAARGQDPPSEVERRLNECGGVLGLSGISSDLRDVLKAARAPGACGARLREAASVYLWRLRKYLGAYLVVADPADAVIFTDTLGETVPLVRHAACIGMEAFGLKLDAARNWEVRDLPADVATDDSHVRILIIATNEELAIAREAHGLFCRASGTGGK